MARHTTEFFPDELTLTDGEGNVLFWIAGNFCCHAEWDGLNWVIGDGRVYASPDANYSKTPRWTRIDDRPDCALIVAAIGDYIRNKPAPEMDSSALRMRY